MGHLNITWVPCKSSPYQGEQYPKPCARAYITVKQHLFRLVWARPIGSAGILKVGLHRYGPCCIHGNLTRLLHRGHGGIDQLSIMSEDGLNLSQPLSFKGLVILGRGGEGRGGREGGLWNFISCGFLNILPKLTIQDTVNKHTHTHTYIPYSSCTRPPPTPACTALS